MLDKSCYWVQGWRSVAWSCFQLALCFTCAKMCDQLPARAACSPAPPPVQSLSGTRSPNKVSSLCAFAPGVLSQHQKVTNTALYHGNENVAETMWVHSFKIFWIYTLNLMYKYTQNLLRYTLFLFHVHIRTVYSVAVGWGIPWNMS